MVTFENQNFKTLGFTGMGYGVKFKSSDEKPIKIDSQTPIPVNTMGFEVDTGNLYYFDEDNTWKLVP